MRSFLRAIPYVFVMATLSACNSPRGTILRSEIIKESQREDASFTVVPVTGVNMARVVKWPATGPGLALNWPGKGQSQATRGLRSGDIVNLTIWDSQENSLIAASEQRFVPVKGLTVSPSGSIFVPYIDEVKVAGLSPEAARSEIQSRLAEIAPSAQVQLEVEPGQRNSIELVSGVSAPGRYPVTGDGLTILSALALGGGIPDALRNPVVRLQRGGKAYAVLAKDLYRDPSRDIMMRGEDRLMVESDSRSFVVLGATGVEKTVHFEKASHSLLEALSLSSGLQESRADVRAVLVLRSYPASALRKDGSGPAQQQIVFTFDFSSGEGLFAGRNFPIYPGDVILATESPLPATASILSVFGSTLGLAQRAAEF